MKELSSRLKCTERRQIQAPVGQKLACRTITNDSEREVQIDTPNDDTGTVSGATARLYVQVERGRYRGVFEGSDFDTPNNALAPGSRGSGECRTELPDSANRQMDKGNYAAAIATPVNGLASRRE